MMKRIVLLLFAMASVALYAASVDSVRARVVAEHFWAARSPKEFSQAALLNLTRQSGLRGIYLFGNEHGFVMVAGSDLVRPVLGYGFGNGFDAADKPVQLDDWIDDYASVMQQLERDGQRQLDGVAAMWNDLIDGKTKPSKSAIAPMITTQWNQGGPYNMLCPYSAQKEARTVAGCVAIAMAQIMKYWNYPIHGSGVHSYPTSRFGALSADFENTYYDWANMPDCNYATDEQREAVATLVYHCGVAVEMNYGTAGEGGSSAYTCDAPVNRLKATTGMIDFFDYQSTMNCRHRSSYTDDGWASLLIRELETGRPMLYTGADETSGHAFVLDGVDDEQLFHINWGWGGAYDGYYAVGAFNPGGGGAGGNATYTFNMTNSAIMGIIPNGVLKCNPEQLSVGQRGGIATSFISSNMIKPEPWVAHTDADWLHFDPEFGFGGGDTTMLMIVADSNATGHSRSAVVSIVQADEVATMLVYQNECGIIDTFPYNEGFEDSVFCWTYTSIDKMNAVNLGPVRNEADAHRGDVYFSFGSANKAAHYDQYLISPYMELPAEATFSFYYKRLYSYNESFEILASKGDERLTNFDTVLNSVQVKRAGWLRAFAKVPPEYHYVAIHYVSNHSRLVAVDDISITVPTPAPEPEPEPDPEGIGTVDRDGVALVLDGRNLTVWGCQNREVAIYDVMGRRLFQAKANGETIETRLPSLGVYLVRVGNSKARRIVALH